MNIWRTYFEKLLYNDEIDKYIILIEEPKIEIENIIKCSRMPKL